MFIAAGSDFSDEIVMVRGGKSADTRTAARMGGGKYHIVYFTTSNVPSTSMSILWLGIAKSM